MSVRLETERLVIRTFEPRDAEPYLEMASDPNFHRFLPPSPPPTLESCRSMIEQRRALERERGYAMWAVEAREGGAFVGQCGLYPLEHRGPGVELAYHFRTVCWGRGYATEAARSVLAHGLGALGLERVIAIVVPENIASCRVVEKIGMRFEAVASYYGLAGLNRYVANRE